MKVFVRLRLFTNEIHIICPRIAEFILWYKNFLLKELNLVRSVRVVVNVFLTFICLSLITSFAKHQSLIMPYKNCTNVMYPIPDYPSQHSWICVTTEISIISLILKGNIIPFDGNRYSKPTLNSANKNSHVSIYVEIRPRNIILTNYAWRHTCPILHQLPISFFKWDCAIIKILSEKLIQGPDLQMFITRSRGLIWPFQRQQFREDYETKHRK